MKDKILALINEGKTTKEIIEITGYSQTHICRVARENGVKIFRRTKNYSPKVYLDNWEEVNLKTFIHDAPRMTRRQLLERYDIGDWKLDTYLAKYNLTPKRPLISKMEKCEYIGVGTGYAPDMHLACGTIYPKHL